MGGFFFFPSKSNIQVSLNCLGLKAQARIACNQQFLQVAVKEYSRYDFHWDTFHIQ